MRPVALPCVLFGKEPYAGSLIRNDIIPHAVHKVRTLVQDSGCGIQTYGCVNHENIFWVKASGPPPADSIASAKVVPGKLGK